MTHSIALRAAAAGMFTVMMLSGCKREQGSNYPTMGADTMSGTTEMAGGDTGKAASSQPGQLSDANIVALLDEANTADSTAGAYALTKATSSQVKAFAKLMMGEHHALRAQGQQLAKQLSVTPEMPTNDPLKPLAMSEMTLLTSSSKSDFDRTYIDQEIDIHKAVLGLAGEAHDAAQSAELKKLIEQAKPVIEKHLARAEQIQKKIGKPSA